MATSVICHHVVKRSLNSAVTKMKRNICWRIKKALSNLRLLKLQTVQAILMALMIASMYHTKLSRSGFLATAITLFYPENDFVVPGLITQDKTRSKRSSWSSIMDIMLIFFYRNHTQRHDFKYGVHDHKNEMK